MAISKKKATDQSKASEESAAPEFQATINQAEIRGTIVRIFYKPGWCTMTVVTSPNKGAKDFPNINWFNESADLIHEQFHAGDRVTIKGDIRTSKKYRTQYIAGRDISITQKEFADMNGISGGRYLPDQNEVKIAGKLEHIFIPQNQEGKIAILTVMTADNDHINFPSIVCFGKSIPSVNGIKEGDFVCLSGHIQTDRKEAEDGKYTYYQSVVAHYLDKATH